MFHNHKRHVWCILCPFRLGRLLLFDLYKEDYLQIYNILNVRLHSFEASEKTEIP